MEIAINELGEHWTEICSIVSELTGKGEYKGFKGVMKEVEVIDGEGDVKCFFNL